MGTRCIASTMAVRLCYIPLGSLLHGWGSVVVTPHLFQDRPPCAPGRLCPGQDPGCSGASEPAALYSL